MPCANATLKRKKSMSSHAASISAWCAVFALAEHRGRVQRLPARGGQQLGGAEEHRRAVLPRPVRPLAVRVAGGVRRGPHVLLARAVELGQHLAVRGTGS
jgi:hypothetical protein